MFAPTNAQTSVLVEIISAETEELLEFLKSLFEISESRSKLFLMASVPVLLTGLFFPKLGHEDCLKVPALSG